MLENPPLDNHTYPLSYVKHVNFLNFEEFGRKNPIYINMVRHPVERVISWYYYIRQSWYQIKPHGMCYSHYGIMGFAMGLFPLRNGVYLVTATIRR